MHLIPKTISLLPPERALSTSDEESDPIREDEPVLAEEPMADPLGDDDVYLFDSEGKLHLLHLCSKDCDNLVKLVVDNNLLGNLRDGALLNGDHSRCLGVGGKHGEQPAAASNLKNHFAAKQVAVVQNCRLPALHPRLVLQELLMDCKVSQRIVEVVLTGHILYVDNSWERACSLNRFFLQVISRF